MCMNALKEHKFLQFKESKYEAILKFDKYDSYKYILFSLLSYQI